VNRILSEKSATFSVGTRQLDLLALDVIGFTPWVNTLSVETGNYAGEAATAALLAGNNAVGLYLATLNYHLVENVGDGALYARTPNSDRGAADLRQVRRMFHRATGLPIRCARAHGDVTSLRLLSVPRESEWLHVGPAIVALYQQLRTHRRRFASIARRTRPHTPRFLADTRGEISVVDCLMLQLTDLENARPISPESVLGAEHLLLLWARRAHAHIDRIGFSDKGLVVRMSRDLDGSSFGNWPSARTLLGALEKLGFEPRMVDARGVVYRGVDLQGVPIVHGPVINSVAKRLDGVVHNISSASQGVDWPAASSDIYPLVGRNRDIDLIDNLVSGLRKPLIRLSGPAGIGKSALLLELSARHWPQHVCVVLHKSSSGSSLRAFSAWRDILCQLCAGDSEYTAASAIEAWDAIVAAELDPFQRAQRLRALVEEWVRGTADSYGLIILLDDLDQLDAASRDLFEVLASCQGFAVVATERTNISETGAVAEAWYDVSLGPLDAKSVQVFSEMLGVPPALLSIAAGNPLYILQLATTSDSINEHEASLDAVIGANISKIGEAALALLRTAALLEQRMSLADLAAASGLAYVRAASELGELIAARMLSIDDTKAGICLAHAMVGVAVRKRMPKGTRLAIARRSLSVLRNRSQDETDMSARLAPLYALSEQPTRATLGYIRTARSAAALGAYGVAETAYARAIATARDSKLQSALSVVIYAEASAAKWALGKVEDAHRTAGMAVRLRSAGRGRNFLAARTLAAGVMGETAYFIGSPGAMIRSSFEFARWAPRGTDRTLGHVRALTVIGFGFAMLGYHGWAQNVFNRACRLAYTRGKTRPTAAYSLMASAIWRTIRGEWEDARAELDEAADCLCEHPEEHHLWEVFVTTYGINRHLRGDAVNAMAYFNQLHTRATARKHKLHQAWALYASCQTQICSGVADQETVDQNCKAQLLLEGLGDVQSEHICLGLAARMAFEQGEDEEALHAAYRVDSVSRGLPPTNYSSLEAYAAAPLIFAAYALKSQAVTDITRAKAAAVQLRVFARRFAYGRPRQKAVKAILLKCEGVSHSHDLILEALAEAQAYGLGFEIRHIEKLKERYFCD